MGDPPPPELQLTDSNGIMITVNIAVSDISSLSFTANGTITATRGSWIWYSQNHFKGTGRIVSPDSGAQYIMMFESGVASVKPWMPASQVILYSGENYTGESLALLQSAASLVGNPYNFNDEARSIRVLGGVWKFYTNVNFSGSVKTRVGPHADSVLGSFDQRISSVKLHR
jgi:hypothetical protein